MASASIRTKSTIRLKRGPSRAASLLSPMPSRVLPTREGNRMEAMRPGQQARATDPSGRQQDASPTGGGSALVEPLSSLFRDRGHRAANRLDRAHPGCAGVCEVRVGSTAALFQKCDRARLRSRRSWKAHASPSRCQHASWQVATAPHKRPADRAMTSCRNSCTRTKALRESSLHANKSRTRFGLAAFTTDVRIRTRQVDVCGRLSRLVGWDHRRSLRAAYCADQPVLSSAAMVDARTLGYAHGGRTVSRSSVPAWRTFR